MEAVVILCTVVAGTLVVNYARKGTESDSVTNSDFSDEQSEDYLEFLSAGESAGETYFEEGAAWRDKKAFSLRAAKSLNALQAPSAAFENPTHKAHNPKHRLLGEVEDDQGKRRVRFGDEEGGKLLDEGGMYQIPKLGKQTEFRSSAYAKRNRKT